MGCQFLIKFPAFPELDNLLSNISILPLSKHFSDDDDDDDDVKTFKS